MRALASVPCLVALVLAACEPDVTSTAPLQTIDDELRQALAVGGWGGGALPVGAMASQPEAQVELGRALFFDKILSGNRDVACATCHQPSTALGDGLSLSIGTGGTGSGPERTLGPGREFVPRNAPSLLNVGLGMPYMLWDGRVSGSGFSAIVAALGTEPSAPGAPVMSVGDALVAQAFLPVVDRREMRGEPGDTDVQGRPNELAAFADMEHFQIWAAIMDRLMAIPEYVDMFAAAFPDTPTAQLGYEHAARALAVFEMAEFTKARSPFDRYLDGDDDAMTTAQKRGALLFFGDASCSTCHVGPFLGGQSFDNVGAPQIGPGAATEPPLDLGRGEAKGGAFYRFAFRVPPLRNVELTAPYMHSGAYPTLEAVVRHYDDVERALRTYDVTQLDPALRDMHHGDEGTIDAIMEALGGTLRTPLDHDRGEQDDLVAFLKSLTDPSARDLGHLIPARVPSGLSVGR